MPSANDSTAKLLGDVLGATTVAILLGIASFNIGAGAALALATGGVQGLAATIIIASILAGGAVWALENAIESGVLLSKSVGGDSGGDEGSSASSDSAGSAGEDSGYSPVNPHPSDPNVPGGAGNYRGRYNAALSNEGLPRLPDDYDVHHSLPQRLRGDPRLEGIDLDAPENLRGVPGYSQPGPQTNVHTLLDQEWSRFLREFPNATRQELLNFRDYLDWKYGHTFWENQVRTARGGQP